MNLHQAYLTNRREIKEIVLTDLQIDVLRLVGPGIDSTDLAAQLGVSTGSAAGLLTRLAAKGWLKRKNVGDPKGGALYVYHRAPGTKRLKGGKLKPAGKV